jgi:hypothetical protein
VTPSPNNRYRPFGNTTSRWTDGAGLGAYVTARWALTTAADWTGTEFVGGA